MPFLPFQASATCNDEIGGKAIGLRRAEAAGANVPDWTVLDRTLVQGRCWRPNSELVAALQVAFRGLDSGSGVMVRSSALAEDGVEQSFAGKFRTVHAPAVGDLEAALEEVAGSLDHPNAAGGGIVLQRHVPSVLAGVAFSVDPVAGSDAELLVEWIEGPSAPLVSGMATPRSRRLPWAAVRARTANELVFSSGQGTPDEVILEAGRVTLLLEEALGRLVDVEWIWDGTAMWVVQARPITSMALSHVQGDECLTSWFFDQRFQTALSPFFRSSVAPRIVRQAVVAPLRMRGRHIDPTSITHWHAGRLYVPHQVMLAVLDGAPDWALTPDLRQVRSGPCDCCRVPRGRTARAWAVCSLLAAGARQIPSLLRNLGRWERFEAGLTDALLAVRELEDSGRWREAWEALGELTDQFLAVHRFSLVLADYAHRRPGSTTRVPHALPTVVANEHLRAVLAGTAPGSHLRGFMHRSASLDLATPTWGEAYGGHLRPDWADIIDPWQPPRRGPVPWRTRLLELREQQRFAWERILAAQRRIVLLIAERLVEEGSLPARDDVWLLTEPELLQGLEGALHLGHAEAAGRRRLLRVESAARAPAWLTPRDPSRPDESARTLAGIGASAGRASGRAWVAAGDDRPPAREEGRILVATAMDPGGTWMLPCFAGVVLERGGTLSHAAIMAREYGVPLVTGVTDARAAIRPGEQITVDGAAGTVTRLGV